METSAAHVGRPPLWEEQGDPRVRWQYLTAWRLRQSDQMTGILLHPVLIEQQSGFLVIMEYMRGGQMAQQLKAFATLAEDLELIFGTHMTVHDFLSFQF